MERGRGRSTGTSAGPQSRRSGRVVVAQKEPSASRAVGGLEVGSTGGTWFQSFDLSKWPPPGSVHLLGGYE